MTIDPGTLRQGDKEWVEELKEILQQGPPNQRDLANRPEATRDSTRKAVKLFFSNLHEGTGKTQDNETSREDVTKVIFNALDQLVTERTKAKKGPSKIEALQSFKAEIAEQGKGKNGFRSTEWENRVGDVILALETEEFEKLYTTGQASTELLAGSKAGRNALQKVYLSDAIRPDARAKMRQEIMGSRAGRQALQKPTLAGAVLSSIDPGSLRGLDIQDEFSPDALMEAFLATAGKPAPRQDDQLDRESHRDPALLNLLARNVAPNLWGVYLGMQPRESQNRIKATLLGTDEGEQALRDAPALCGAVLCSADLNTLRQLDIRATLGEQALTDAMREVQRKCSVKEDIDPEVFKHLATQIRPDVWNDGSGLGPRVCQALWDANQYRQICDLIEHGIDTTVPARAADQQSGRGVYSGFVQPIQHVVSKCLRDVALVKSRDTTLSFDRSKQATGAKLILEALDDKGTALTLTSWKEVEESELVKQFTGENAKPGTIWGFEDIRHPFVQAAHNSEHGAQPLRMMELWDAVVESLTAEAYDLLLTKPDKAADKFVALGVAKIEEKLASKEVAEQLKVADIKDHKDEFIRQFKLDAKAFLLEFAQQMPKGTATRPALDGRGKPQKFSVGEAAGIEQNKYMGGLACKAGLWWAQKEGKPIYYCLDGIKMEDVINYKLVKKKAVEDFIANGGKSAGAKGHDEVITMVELREIIKNWEQLKKTVVFVRKGVIVKPETAELEVQDWLRQMTLKNKEAGRIPAPSKATFTRQLSEIDKTLLDTIPDGPVGDMDARDIVKKCGYLLKVANAHPEIVLKYIMLRCEILRIYGILPVGLPDAAAEFSNATRETITAKRAKLIEELKKCNRKFRKPLEAALLRHPLMTNSRDL